MIYKLKNKQVYDRIKKVNDVLADNLLKVVDGKKVLVDISGGHDTRVNLAILLNHEIDFTGYTVNFSKKDIPIANKLASFCSFPHIVNYKRDEEKELLLKYDIEITGEGFSEIMNVMHMMNRSYHMIKDVISIHENVGYRYSPIMDENAIDVMKDVPIGYLFGGVVQKTIIGMNKPELLDVPFTYYDYRHLILNKFYIYFADFIFNSYYRGKGRNIFETKKSKDVWWRSDEQKSL